MVKKFNGENPVNARIRIDYRGKKPDVRFSYPDKKNQYRGNMFIPVFFFFVIVFFLIFRGVEIERWKSEDLNEFKGIETDLDLKDYNQCRLFYNENEELLEDKVCEDLGKSLSERLYGEIKILLRDYLFEFFITFMLPLFIYFSFKKRWDKLYPKWQSLFGSKKYVCFTSKDVKEKDGKFYCEIPLFNNIVLNYDAKDDFAKFMELFEIEEYKFKHFKLKKIKGSKRKKKPLNEWLWYARFYFSKKPIKGKLEVVFK